MDVSEILDGLNDAQREAVTADARVLRVIAGAGSGKTRVLVQRMLWLMQVEGMAAHSLLALTFTNKAAREMRGRLEEALQRPLDSTWMGTFHGICYRILRRHADRMDWTRDFAVMDGEDQLALIKRLMQAVNWQDAAVGAKDLRNYINHHKEEGRRAADVVVRYARESVFRDFYGEYERVCRAQGRMDFAELLLLTVELLQAHEDLRQAFNRRFHGILVDEFQDTNRLQMQFLHLMLDREAKLFVVGDDDQSIYSWRGARIENMLDLDSQYPELMTVRLEQNYRSTQTILNAANALIANNGRRLGKTLWSAAGEGEAIALFPARNEYEEAEYVCGQIAQCHEQGGRYADCAILYRSNALSRVLEEVLLRRQIPYRVYGGLRFFERTEIKDALAYLRLSQYPEDDSALERIINLPARGIGAKTVDELRQLARQGGLSIWQVVTDDDILTRHFNARAVNAVKKFRALMLGLREKIQAAAQVKSALHQVVHDSGLYAMYENSHKDDGQSRKENLDELISAGAYADARGSELTLDERLQQFLADAALDAGDNEADAGTDSVQMMTLHSAKGLEFPQVFIVACEEDIFPSHYNSQNATQLEEERRLAYVGITRAMRKLTLSFAERRRYQGNERYPELSRFVREIPEEYLHPVRPLLFRAIMPTKEAAETADGAPLKSGDAVAHPKFGEGVVQMLEGHGNNRRALVSFRRHGEKWLVLAYAKLEKQV